jgi:polyhydroxybutyrate depolymerase
LYDLILSNKVIFIEHFIFDHAHSNLTVKINQTPLTFKFPFISAHLSKTLLLVCMLTCGYISAHAQLVSDSIQVEGHFRAFHFLKPLEQSKPQSLIFILHGSGGDGIGIRKGAAHFESVAQQEGAMVVYPDGYKRYWNECRKAATSQANLEDINDTAFFQSMIAYFTSRYGISPKRVFVIGTSGGGHMAYKLAMVIPESITAISALIANLPTKENMDCVPKQKPVPVMIVNGTKDEINPYEGGEVKIAKVKLGFVQSTEKTFQYWAKLNGYKGKPVRELLPDIDPADGKTIERYTYFKKNHHEVTLFKVIGGKHDFPNDIDVYAESWSFFKRQMTGW